jgi:hypothetical protein
LTPTATLAFLRTCSKLNGIILVHTLTSVSISLVASFSTPIGQAAVEMFHRALTTLNSFYGSEKQDVGNSSCFFIPSENGFHGAKAASPKKTARS